MIAVMLRKKHLKTDMVRIDMGPMDMKLKESLKVLTAQPGARLVDGVKPFRW